MSALRLPWSGLRAPSIDRRELVGIDRAAEAPPSSLGLRAGEVERVWAAVERLYDTGLQPAITLVIRREGRIVLKRSIGAIRGHRPGDTGPLVPLTPDTPVCLFSASKAISALLVHKLVEDGKLSLDDRVAAYLPAFAAHGKHRVTLRELLGHRAGIPTFVVENEGPELLHDWDALVARLCAAKPFDPRFEKQAYHALTAGFIVGEVVQRVSGLPLREALRQWITEPLALPRMGFGLPPDQRRHVPPNTVTGPRPVWPLTRYIRSIISMEFAEGVAASNEDSFLSTVVPAGNLFATADEVSRVFQMMLNGGTLDGVRLFQPETLAQAVAPLGGLQFDRTIRVPLRFSAGFMLGENPFGLFGPNTRRAYGHLGFVSVLAWADPDRALSVALLNTGKSLAPVGLLRMGQILAAIGRAFPAA